jgi:hypothetical protein
VLQVKDLWGLSVGKRVMALGGEIARELEALPGRRGCDLILSPPLGRFLTKRKRAVVAQG